jgi:lipid-binding SYLF domain-containing protein
MRTSKFGKSFFSAVATLIVAAGTMLFADLAIAAPDGTIQFTLYKAGFIVGGSGGSGTLKFKGKQYPLSIGGVSLGATIGVSKAELIGEVFNLKNPSDIEGTYTAGQASVAVAGGAKVAELKNSKGVVLKVKGKQIGLELALDLSGMEVSLKK